MIAALILTALMLGCPLIARSVTIPCECVGGPHGGYTCPRCRP